MKKLLWLIPGAAVLLIAISLFAQVPFTGGNYGIISRDSYTPGGTDVPLADGGTNASLVASNGGIFYSTASAGAILSGTATATQMLQSGASGAPAWSTATWPATTTINQILYSSANNTVTGLATGNSGLLCTSGTGVPSICTQISLASGGVVGFGTNVLTLGAASNAFFMKGDTSADQSTLAVGSSTGGALDIVPAATYTSDCTSGDETDPKVRVHSATDCATTKLQFTGVRHNVTDGIVDTGAGMLRLQPAIKGVVLPLQEAAVPAEPIACASGTVGTVQYVDDNNDTAIAQICVCIAITDNTYDWRKLDDTATACSFY